MSNTTSNKEIKKTTSNTPAKVKNVETDKMKALEKQLLEQGELIKQLIDGNKTAQAVEKSPITGKTIVTVTSLCNNLTLTSEPRGKGREFLFSSYGQTKRIEFEDVQKILYVDYQERMAKNLKFMIDNQELITSFDLDNVYKVKPNTKDFKDILSCSKTRIKDIMSKVSQKSREDLFRRSVELFNKNKGTLDYNKVELLSTYFPEDKDLQSYFK